MNRIIVTLQRLVRYFLPAISAQQPSVISIESGAPVDQIHIAALPALARHTDNLPEAIWSISAFCTLTVIGALGIGAQ